MLKNLFFHEKLMNIFENTRLFERENDYEQIKNAEELYDRILKKLESAKVAISYVSLQPECDLKLYFVSELRDQNRNDIAWFIPKINTIMLNSKLGKK